MTPQRDATPTVFVIGLDGHHRPVLEKFAASRGIQVEGLLSFQDVRKARSYDIDALLDKARHELDRAGAEVAGITTYWDFPSSCLAPILCEERALPTAGLAPVALFEHKFWSRLAQADVAPHATPRFVAVDPFAEDAADQVDLAPPYWIKPVKSYSGHLGFRVDGPDDLDHALGVLRSRIGRLGRPFQQVLDRVDGPPDAQHVGGSWAVAEELLDGQQVTLEGHLQRGAVEIHGVFDIVREDGSSTFSRYTYPSRLPAHAYERMVAVAADLMTRSGYGAGAFNIEFFHDGDADEIFILEVNPRISQEHSKLMGWVDDATNLEIMVDLALDRTPPIPEHEGSCPVAAKFFHRSFEDGVVVSTPEPAEVADIERRFAPCAVETLVREGDRLSELEDQESYSYELAYVHLAGESHPELEDRFAEIVDRLDIRVDPAA